MAPCQISLLGAVPPEIGRAQETDPKFKTLLEKNADEYFKLAEKRAEELGLPPPKRPKDLNPA